MTKEFYGHKKQLETIRLAITNPRESSIINIIGTYGSGRSALLDSIEHNVLSKNWQMPQSRDPIVITIQGTNFSQGDDLIDFFHYQVINKIQAIPDMNINAEEDLPTILRKVSAQDYPIIIMIDNFTRIMEKINPLEAQGLNRLRPAGVHYILVTDFRSLEEISSRVYIISDFFKTAHPIHLTPVTTEEAVHIIEQEINEYSLKDKCTLEGKYIESIVDLGGGNPGLLKAISRYLCYELGGMNTIVKNNALDSREWNRILRNLPVEDTIHYYLTLILDSVLKLSIRERESLIEISFEQFTQDLEVQLAKKFRVMGLLASDNVRISGKLMQFIILNNLITVNFSDAETKAFELFYRSRPGLITFDDLNIAIKDYVEENNPESARQFIDSTVSRIRKKIADIPNCIAFSITNERGLGFYARSEISFDLFYLNGPSVFLKK